jgi:hypothetical protein
MNVISSFFVPEGGWANNFFKILKMEGQLIPAAILAWKIQLKVQ